MSNLTREDYKRQYKHIGNVRHGVQTAPWRVEFPAKLKDEANALKIFQGSVVSLNADGQYVAGCAAGTGANCPVPCISLKNVFDPDVTTGIAGADMAESTYSSVGGKITAIPVTCGYELETTEFDNTATYYPNDALTAGTGDKLGKVVKAAGAPGGAEPVLGFVSLPPHKDYFNNTRIAFFAAFVPAGVSGLSGASELDVSGSGSTVTWSYDDGKLIATLS